MLRIAQGASTYMVKSSGASSEKSFGEKTGIVKIRIGDYEVPTEADGEMWIRFTKQAKERYLPAWKVLNGEIGKEAIEGRLAIVGTSAAGLLDLRATPLEASVPGVELHAQAIEQILKAPSSNGRTSPRRPSCSTSLCLAFSSPFWSIAWRAGSAAACRPPVATIIAMSWYAFDAMAGWSIRLPGACAHRHLPRRNGVRVPSHRAERNRVRHAFGHYMAPSLGRAAGRRPSRLKLGGERAT